MDAILTRAGWWFGAVVLAVIAAAGAHDSGFAAQMMIVAVVALAGLWISVIRADVGAIASGILRMPADPSKYDDDPVRWGVLAAVFWAIVGMAVGLNLALMHFYEMDRLPVVYTLIGVVAVLVLGQCAVFVPARRASNVPPVTATRAV